MNIIFRIFIAITLVSCAALFCDAQTANQLSSKVPIETPYAVINRDANSKTWEKTTYEIDPTGKVVPKKHQYTELGTGMNYLQNGQWVESQEQINILSDGSAAATQGQHQAHFPGDIYQGAVELVTPDGRHLVSRPVGLSYDDGTKTVFIAELKSSVGQLIGSNQVIYPDAFTDFKADIRYTYTKAGFEQDIVLREQPPTPESYGLNPQTAHLQVLTEFFNAPEPSAAANTLYEKDGPGDVTLQFGQMKMIHGKAFAIDDSTQTMPFAGGISVGKTWLHLEGRTFLVEELPVQKIESQLQALPVAAAATVSTLINSNHKVSLTRQLVPARPIQASTHSIQFAKRDLKSTSGLVLDYVTVNSVVTNFTFRGDTTYLVSTLSFEADGTTTIEGGTVIKFATNSANFTLNYFGTIICQTAPYRPAIFTVLDDNSVGETIAGSTGNPVNYGNGGISIYNNYGIALHDIRLSYLNYGLGINAASAQLDNIQADNCTVPILQAWANVTINNALFYNIGNLAIGVSGGTPTLTGLQITAHNCNNFANASQISLTNCLFVTTTNISSGGGTLNTNAVTVLTSAAGVFQSAGAGGHYLPAGSAYRDAGSTNIDPNVLASLSLRTTFAPLVYSNLTFSISTNFSTQVLRDTNTPDLGYHYDPLDYITDGVTITNGTLTVTNGIAIACYNEPGILLRDGSSMVSVGTPLAPNWLVRYQSVQEQPVLLGGTNISTAQNVSAAALGTSRPNGTFQFTRFSTPAAGGWHFNHTGNSSFNNLTVQHTELWGGTNDFSGPTNAASALLQNNLFYRSAISASNSAASAGLSFSNNLIYGTAVALVKPAVGAWYFFNNDVDSSTISTNSVITNGYNAFINCSFNLVGTSNIVSTNAIVYQAGSLGNFYQPTNSPLINAGSTSNLQVFYHFTTQTNQLIESNSVVDIGYHYVALGANGKPLDSNSNGIPDYIEDGNILQGVGIVVQPANQTIVISNNATFSVTASGTAPLSYQWWFNVTNKLAAATNPSLTITNCQLTNAGNYSVVITNVVNSVTSSLASLTVLLPPSISLTNPANNSSFTACTNIGLGATASDADGTVTFVQFFQGTNSLGIVSNAPYVLTWTNVATGTYALSAQATDNSGLIATSAIVNITVTSAGPTLAGMVNWWRAETNALDSIGTNNGALQGGIGYTNGMVGKAFAFNGVDSVFLATNTYLAGGNTAHTIEGWIYINALPAVRSWILVFGSPNPGSHHWLLNADGSTQLGVWSGSQALPTLPVGSWVHLGMTFDGTTLCCYTNGRLQSAQAATFNFTNPIPLTMGQPQYGQEFFNGRLDEVSLYNRALSSNEIASIYNAGSAGKSGSFSVTLTSPVNNSIYYTGTNISLGATAIDFQGTVTKVQFFQGTTSLGTISNAPYTLVWSNVPAGNYALTAVATDNNGSTATSSVVNITISSLFTSNSMSLWLKSDTFTGLTNNAPIVVWADQSGRGNDAIQITSTYRPTWVTNGINTYPVVDFNGSQYLALTNGTSLMTNAGEIFIILRSTAPGTLWQLGNGSLSYYPNFYQNIYETFGTTATYLLGTPAQAFNQYHSYNVSAQTGYWAAWINGVMLYETSQNAFSVVAGPAYIGGPGGSDFNGDIAEVLLFNRALTASERTTVNVYLNGKYGLVQGVPMTPTNLVARAVSTSQISLTWNETLTNGGATQTSIERSTVSNGTYVAVAQLANALSYLDTNLSAGTTYYYRARAINLATWSGYSTIAQATTFTNGINLPLSDLTLWLKADTGLAQIATNAPVNFWMDQSGHGNDAAQTSASTRPTWVPGGVNSSPVVDFNGSQDFVLTNGTSLLTNAGDIFVVLRSVGLSGLWQFENSGASYYPNFYQNIYETFGSTTSYLLGTPTQAINQYHLYNVNAQTGYWAAWLNGIMLSETSQNTFVINNAPVYLGYGSSYLNGDIAEVMLFDRTLTGDERLAVGNYLFSKYQLLQFATNAVVPGAPTNVLVTGKQPGINNVGWVPTSTNATTFQVERKQGAGGTYQEVINVPGYFFSGYDTLPSTTNQYVYRVKALNYFGASGYSSEISPPVAIMTNWPATIFENKTNSLGAKATDASGVISNVQFYADNNLIGTSFSSPYSVTNWIPTFAGNHIISALAVDTQGNSQYSSSVTLTAFLDSNGDGIPDIFQVQGGNDPINPWTPPVGGTNNIAPHIFLTVPTNSILLP